MRRRWINHLARLMLLLLTIAAALPFVFIVFYVIQKGASALHWSFFTELPKGPGEQDPGGMANAIVGSLIMVGLASLMAIPWGLGTGLYLSEYGRGKTAKSLRFAIDLLTSVPSIIIGIFIYGVLVAQFGFSAVAGALALGIIMIPTVARSTEEILKLIPNHIREAGLALGLPRWKVIIHLLIPGARKALTTGIMLGVARIFGETAPLLFTSLGNQFFSRSLNQPMAAMPLQIYNLAKSGYAELEAQAWAGAMVLVAIVILLNLLTRIILGGNEAT